MGPEEAQRASPPAPVTHGVTHRAVHVGDFRLTETSHAPYTRLGRHSHAFPAITFVLHGGFSEDFGGRDIHECGAMSLLAKPAGAAHTNDYSARGARSFIVEYTGTSPAYRALEGVVPRHAATRLVVPMLELYDAFRGNAPEQLILAEELALEVGRDDARTARQATPRRPAWLPAVAEAIAADCTSPFRLTTLAAAIGTHPVHLARVFRRHYGRSVGSYILQCRLRLAMARLATTTEPISRIAFECGFTDQPYFTRLFRRETGVPPGRFRRLSVSRLARN